MAMPVNPARDTFTEALRDHIMVASIERLDREFGITPGSDLRTLVRRARLHHQRRRAFVSGLAVGTILAVLAWALL